MEIQNTFEKIAQLRKDSTVEHVDALIYLNVFGLIAVMFLFGYLIKNGTLLKIFFVLGLFLLVILIVARRTWYGSSPMAAVFEHEKKKQEEVNNQQMKGGKV